MKLETRIKKQKEIDEKMDKWLKEHNGAFPRRYIIRDGKTLRSKELSPEELEEVSLAMKWELYYGKENAKKARSDGRKISTVVSWFKENRGRMPKNSNSSAQTIEQKRERSVYEILRDPIFKKINAEYDDVPLDEIPVKYREYMRLYREIPQKNETFEMIIRWLDEHDGEMPRYGICKNGKRLSRREMSEEEKEEVRTNNSWRDSKARRIFEQYMDTPIEEIPSQYREYISKMRAFGYGVKEENWFEELIEWLEEHQERLPRVTDRKSRKKMTKDEKYELSLRKKWDNSKEKEILDEYTGRPLEEVPEEYREKIAILRSYDLGITEEERNDQIFIWLEEHNGMLPRYAIVESDKKVSRRTLSREEYREIRLHRRWLESEIRMVLEKYAGRPIEEVPEEHREKIAILRSYGLGREKIEYDDVFEEIIKWMKTHKGKMPRTAIYIPGKKFEQREVKKVKDMTDEERYEISISHNWFRTKEREIFIQYDGRPLEEVPKEYRERIKILRETIEEGRQENRIIGDNFFEEFILWVEENDNKTPRAEIRVNNRRIPYEELSTEQIYECRIYKRWQKAEERRILNEYAGRPIEEVPEEYREKIKILREHGLLGKKVQKRIRNRMKSAVSSQVGSNDATRAELGLEVVREDKQFE